MANVVNNQEQSDSAQYAPVLGAVCRCGCLLNAHVKVIEELFGTDKERALARRNELSDQGHRVSFLTYLPDGGIIATEGKRMWRVK